MFKKVLSIILLISVLSLGLASAIPNIYALEKPSINVSDNGMVANIINGTNKLCITKIDKYNATISINSNGKVDSAKIIVSPLKNNKYKITSINLNNNKKYEIIGNINPLTIPFSENVNTLRTPENEPNALVYCLVEGKTPTFENLMEAFGPTVAGYIIEHWDDIEQAWEIGGFWFVVSVLSSWEIVGAAMAITVAY